MQQNSRLPDFQRTDMTNFNFDVMVTDNTQDLTNMDYGSDAICDATANNIADTLRDMHFSSDAIYDAITYDATQTLTYVNYGSDVICNVMGIDVTQALRNKGYGSYAVCDERETCGRCVASQGMKLDAVNETRAGRTQHPIHRQQSVDNKGTDFTHQQHFKQNCVTLITRFLNIDGKIGTCQSNHHKSYETDSEMGFGIGKESVPRVYQDMNKQNTVTSDRETETSESRFDTACAFIKGDKMFQRDGDKNERMLFEHKRAAEEPEASLDESKNVKSDGEDFQSVHPSRPEKKKRKKKTQARSYTASFKDSLLPPRPLKLLPSVLLRFFLFHLLPLTSAVVIKEEMSKRLINMPSGKIRGVLVEFPNDQLRPIDAFFGLKYADLEKGNMRFMPPKHPKEHWGGTRHAIAFQPPCPQLIPKNHGGASSLGSHLASPDRAAHLRNITPFLTEQMEDCLTLNLYVPRKQWNDTSLLPVMVFIHGESYDTGTGNAYDGSVLASFGDVIVVTLNYRLGVLGFLTTLDNKALGNRSLFDIIQALIWLRENIVSFHGDPDNLTLFGHGHGASLVNLLLLSPLASTPRPLFQRAILQSGSALATWSLSYDPIWCTEKLAYDVNCSAHIGHSDRLVNCLRQRTVSELLQGAPQAPKYYSCFAPAANNWGALPAQVEHLISERNSSFSTVPLLLGITKNEAYSYLKPQEIHSGLSDLRKRQILRTYVQNIYRYHRQKIYEILHHQYTDWTKLSNKMANRDSILELLGDGQYVAPLIRTANYHADTADTFLYVFSHSSQSEESSAQPQPSDNLQSIHGDELPYVFGSPLVGGLSPFPSSYTAQEKMISEAVMTYWTNFATSGDPNRPRKQRSLGEPNSSNQFKDLAWPKYEKSTQQYMQIGERPAVRHHYRSQKLAVWLDLIPKMNVADGGSMEPGSHQLNNADNRTTFDDHHLLIQLFEKVFPTPPPMPPLVPSLTYPQDEGTTPSFIFSKKPNSRGKPSSVDGLLEPCPERGGGGDVPGPTVAANTGKEGVGSGRGGGVVGGVEGEGGGVGRAVCVEGGGASTSSLSITVAVGCTLFFLNLLIFAAVYYQRVRIQKMRQADDNSPRELLGYDMDDEAGLSRKLEKEANASSAAGGDIGDGGGSGGGDGGAGHARGCADSAGHETDSLMSAGTGLGLAGEGSTLPHHHPAGHFSSTALGVGGGGGGGSPATSRNAGRIKGEVGMDDSGRGGDGGGGGGGGGGMVTGGGASEFSTLERGSVSPATTMTATAARSSSSPTTAPRHTISDRNNHLPRGGGGGVGGGAGGGAGVGMTPHNHQRPYPQPFHYPPDTRSGYGTATSSQPHHNPYHTHSHVHHPSPSPPPPPTIGGGPITPYGGPPSSGSALSRPFALNPFSSAYLNNRAGAGPGAVGGTGGGAKLGSGFGGGGTNVGSYSPPSRGGPRGPLASRSEAADTGLYKVINKPNPYQHQPLPAPPSAATRGGGGSGCSSSRDLPQPSSSSSYAGRGSGGGGGANRGSSSALSSAGSTGNSQTIV